MAKANYMASTSRDDQFQIPSVEIIDPKSKSSSIDSSEDKLLEEETDHSFKPSDKAWKQQNLPAWQPILTENTVLPAFFLLGVVFIPVGIGLLITSNQLREIRYDYTNCHQYNDPKAECSNKIGNGKQTKCECHENFTLSDDFKAPVFFYYGLSKYYQNHRRYVQFKDDSLFKNQPIPLSGLISDSLFNDTFKLFYRDTHYSKQQVNLIQTEIAWPTDDEIKFESPGLSPNYPDQNEHLLVWMKRATFPSFRKLWGRIDHHQNIKWETSLPKGNYVLQIEYNYPVILDKFNGRKEFIISNTSWIGGKNNFLGYAYIVVGSLFIILWAVFLIIVKKYSQNAKDVVDIGPKTPYQMANLNSTN